MREVIKRIQPALFALLVIVLASVALSVDASAFSIQEGVNAARGTNQPADLFGAGGVITILTNTLLFIVGALSVVMIIIGGLRYVVSGGNSTAVTAAKNTILYAVVGLVIAFLAFAAINFVMNTIAPGTGGAGYTNV
ncbi:MAG: hypothetical protein WAV04_00620 [Candidatus Microsaccharimonas sp.]